MAEASGISGPSKIDASKLIRLRHGSKDSVDVDIVWVSFEPLPPRVDCLAFCNSSKAENGNLIYVDKEQGVVLEVLKGMCDIFSSQTLRGKIYFRFFDSRKHFVALPSLP
jgi:hypothetical protein